MRIEEIVVDPKKLLIDQLISNTTNEVIEIFNLISNETNNFQYKAYELYSANIIQDYLSELIALYKIILLYYDKKSQTYQIIQYLINYFENN
jgi:hypothetical protein